MLDQLRTAETQRVDVLNQQKDTLSLKYTAWQDFDKKLSSLQSAAKDLQDPDSFHLYTASSTSSSSSVSADSILSASTSSSAVKATYQVKVNNLAQAEKLSSTAFSSSTDPRGLAGKIRVNDTEITIGAGDSLEVIRDAINQANTGTTPSGVSASIIHAQDGYHMVLSSEKEGASGISLVNEAGDSVLEGLGLDKRGVKSGTALTTDGQTPVTGSTLIKGIHGYLNPGSGDKIAISGKDHDGVAISSSDFSITDTSTVDDLLTAIETAYGGAANVEASIDSEGKIQVTDKQTGSSQMSLSLVSTPNGPNFGDFNDLHRNVLQEGKDASLTIDGLSVTSSTNEVTDAVSGLSLQLKGADPNTTVTIKIDKDKDGIEKKVKALVDAYNEVIDFTNTQQAYNSDTKETGGPLFGDSLLRSIKTSIQSSIVNPLSDTTGLSLTNLGSIGISMGADNKLTLDSTTFQEKLDGNFENVVQLFSNYGKAVNNDVDKTVNNDTQYFYSSKDTKAGTYSIDITQVATKASASGAGANWGSGYSGATGDDLVLTDSVTGKSITKTFTQGETLDDVVSGLNSLFKAQGIDISASIDEQNQLSLTGGEYGSGKSFTLTGSAKASLGITADSVDGKDVAGTIDGVAATGSGRILKATSGNANGLHVLYTGTDVPSAGPLSFTYTRGGASALDKLMADATDLVDGLVTKQENSTKSNMDKLDSKISSVQDQIDRRMERYLTQFQALETALQNLQSTQSWLSSQLAGLSS
jgi:flagellar hook-associated protein 2